MFFSFDSKEMDRLNFGEKIRRLRTYRGLKILLFLLSFRSGNQSIKQLG
jgi:hypothetical protein